MSEQTTYPAITMYSTSWCGDCRRSKRLLDGHGVPYTEINIEQQRDALPAMLQYTGGKRSVPTIVLDNGTVLIEPSDRELARAVGIPL